MSSFISAVLIFLVAAVFVIAAVALMVSRLFRKVPQGQALVVSKWRTVDVTFTGQLVIPVIHKAEVMDISVKNIQIDRRGRHNGLICQDNIRADIAVEFFVKVNADREDVVRVAQAIGCARASDIETLHHLFASKFSEALKTAGKRFDFEELYTERQLFRDAVLEIIGRDLNGYHLEDVAIDFLEQTQLADYDPDNIMDAAGIKKITERTAHEHIETNKHEQREREETTRRTVDADKAVLEMERDRAEATARQQQEIRSIEASTAAAASVVEENERQRTEGARITTDQGLGVASENRDREIAIAALNRERVVQVETENIERDRLLAVTGRDTAVAEASKDREVRVRELAEVARGRVEAELGVAEREEAIKTLRIVEDASRNATAEVKTAEGLAQASFVGTVKEAEAGKSAAVSEAERTTTLARANAAAAEQDSLAAQRRADGERATVAAPGLAEVEVERQRAAAIRDVGLAEVEVVRERGVADGEAMKSRLSGEGEGLSAKAEGVGAMTSAGQEHEEFRLRLDKDRDVALAAIGARAEVAKAGAAAVGQSMSNADMKIISDAGIVERIMRAAGVGESFDAFIENGDAAAKVLDPYLSGQANLVQDLAEGIGGVGASGIRDLTVAKFVAALGDRLGEGEDAAGVISQLAAAVDAAGIGALGIGDVVSTDTTSSEK